MFPTVPYSIGGAQGMMVLLLMTMTTPSHYPTSVAPEPPFPIAMFTLIPGLRV